MLLYEVALYNKKEYAIDHPKTNIKDPSCTIGMKCVEDRHWLKVGKTECSKDIAVDQ